MLPSTRDILLATVASTIAVLLLFPFASVGVDPHHDGIMLKPAIDVVDGQVLHRDTFTQYGPLTTLCHAALLWLFGKKLIVLRVATLVMECASVGVMALAWRALLPWRAILPAVVLWCCLPYFYSPLTHLLPWSSSLALLLQSLSILAHSSAFRASTVSRAVILTALAGVLASATFWCRQPVGAFLAMAGVSGPLALQYRWRKPPTWSLRQILIYLVANRFLLAYVLGGVSLALGMAAWLTLNGAAEAWYEQNILWPRRWSGQYFSIRFLLECIYKPETYKPLLAFSAIALAVAVIFRRKQVLVRIILCLSLVPIILWLNASIRNLFWEAHVERMIPFAICLALTAALLRGRLDAVKAAIAPGMLVPVLASWTQFYPVPCARHMYWAVTPMIGLFVFAFKDAFSLRASTIGAAILLLAAPMTLNRLREARSEMRLVGKPIVDVEVLKGMRPYRPIANSDKLFYYHERDVACFRALERDLKRHCPEKPMVLLGPDALLSLAAGDRENPGPYYVNWGKASDPRVEQVQTQFIRHRRPVVLIQAKPGESPQIPAVADELGYVLQSRGHAFRSDIYLLVPPESSLARVSTRPSKLR